MLTITIGPARPRLAGDNRRGHTPTSRATMSLARVASRHGATTVVDGQGGAMVIGADAGDVELF